MEGFIVILFNLAHPSKDVVPMMADDGDENAFVFQTEREAQKWIDDHKRAPFGYAICDLSELDVETY